MILFSCTEKDKNMSDNFKDTKKVFQNSETNKFDAQLVDFVSWLNDTLISMKVWEKELNKINYLKEINISNDSLDLVTKSHFKLKYNNKISYSQEVEKIIELLTEYGELPPENDTISFTEYWDFYPSHIPNKRREFIYELKDLIVIGNKQKIKYDYIRGRLSGKNIFDMNDKEIEKFDFIWSDEGGNNLKKIRK